MHEWIQGELERRGHAPLPRRLFDEARRRTMDARRRLIGLREHLSSENVIAVIELPSERNLARQVHNNPSAFDVIAAMIGLDSAQGMSETADTLYERYFQRLSEINASPRGNDNYKPIKVGGGKEVILELSRAHDTMHYPFTIANPKEREKIFSILGMDFVAASLFERRDGLGSRFRRMSFTQTDASIPREITLVEQIDDEYDIPLGVNRVFDQIPKIDGRYPIGLTIYAFNPGEEQAYAATVVPSSEQFTRIPKLVVLAPEEDGEIADSFEKARHENQRIDVLVKSVHLPIIRNFLIPSNELHVIERDELGRPVRVDGYKEPLSELPKFSNSYYFVIDPVEGNVDETTRRERRRLDTASGKQGEDRFRTILGLDVVESGDTARRLGLNRTIELMPAQLTVVRATPSPQGGIFIA